MKSLGYKFGIHLIPNRDFDTVVRSNVSVGVSIWL